MLTASELVNAAAIPAAQVECPSFTLNNNRFTAVSGNQLQPLKGSANLHELCFTVDLQYQTSNNAVISIARVATREEASSSPANSQPARREHLRAAAQKCL